MPANTTADTDEEEADFDMMDARAAASSTDGKAVASKPKVKDGSATAQRRTKKRKPSVRPEVGAKPEAEAAEVKEEANVEVKAKAKVKVKVKGKKKAEATVKTKAKAKGKAKSKAKSKSKAKAKVAGSQPAAVEEDDEQEDEEEEEEEEEEDKEDEADVPMRRPAAVAHDVPSLYGRVAERHGLTTTKIRKVIHDTVILIGEELKLTGRCQAPGLALFKVNQRPARAAGEQMMFGKMRHVPAKEAKTTLKWFPHRLMKGVAMGTVDSSSFKVTAHRASRADSRKPPLKVEGAPAEDAQFKVRRALHLNLGVQVGKTYTYKHLLQRCKGSEARATKLVEFTRNGEVLEPVNS